MKLIILMFLLASINANATNYYFDNSGSDANAGTSSGTAWQTISKANSSMGSFVAGDSLLFRGDGTFTGQLIITTAGLKIGRYGTGNNPIFSGFTTISLTNIGGNIWQGTATLKGLNTVLYNGVMVAKGRAPNTGYYTFSSHTSDTLSITGSLSGTPNYAGGEVVVRTNHWILDNKRITSQVAGKFNFATHLTYPPINGYGYFIQNILSVLDVNGEWCYDSTTNLFSIYSTTTPNIQVSNTDTCIFVNAKYVSINNIHIDGANDAGIQLFYANGDTIQHCLITNSGTCGIRMFHTDTSYIRYDSVINSLSNGMYLRYPVDSVVGVNNYYLTVLDNYIDSVGLFQGMGLSGNQTYVGMTLGGDNCTAERNVIKHIGYNGLMGFGSHWEAKNNNISYTNIIKNDGGGLHIFTQKTDIKITGNIIHDIDCSGATDGTGGLPFIAAGIYLDGGISGVKCENNTIFNIHGGYGIPFFLNLGSNDTVRYNTLMGGDTASMAISGTGTGNLIAGNKFISTNTTSVAFEKTNGCCSFGRLDSNFYSKPLNENTSLMIAGASYFPQSLATFKVASGGYETHGFITPAGTIGVPVIYYNTTNTNITITLPSKMKDYMGTVYSGSVTIAPYTSIVLYNYNSKIYFGYYSK